MAEDSEFLLGILLEENKHVNIFDYVIKDNTNNYYCLCVCLEIIKNKDDISNSFFESNLFLEKYFDIYANGLSNYYKIIDSSSGSRQVYLDEALTQYDLKMTTTTMSLLLTNEENRNAIVSILENIKLNHSYAIILRNEIAFTIIHHISDEYILIDPHVEYSGILTQKGIFKYLVYDDIWNFDVSVIQCDNN